MHLEKIQKVMNTTDDPKVKRRFESSLKRLEKEWSSFSLLSKKHERKLDDRI